MRKFITFDDRDNTVVFNTIHKDETISIIKQDRFSYEQNVNHNYASNPIIINRKKY